MQTSCNIQEQRGQIGLRRKTSEQAYQVTESDSQNIWNQDEECRLIMRLNILQKQLKTFWRQEMRYSSVAKKNHLISTKKCSYKLQLKDPSLSNSREEIFNELKTLLTTENTHPNIKNSVNFIVMYVVQKLLCPWKRRYSVKLIKFHETI